MIRYYIFLLILLNASADLLEDFTDECYHRSGGSDCRSFRQCCESKTCPLRITTSMSCQFDKYTNDIVRVNSFCKCTTRHTATTGVKEASSSKYSDFQSCSIGSRNCSDYLACCDRFKICPEGQRRIRVCEGTSTKITTTGCLCIPDRIHKATTVRMDSTGRTVGVPIHETQALQPEKNPDYEPQRHEPNQRSVNGAAALSLSFSLFFCLAVKV